jgi:hypothetical protein
VQSYEPVPLLAHAVAFQAISGQDEVIRRLMGFVTTDPAACEPALLNMAGIRFAVLPLGASELPPGWILRARGELPAEFTRRGAPSATIAYAVYENRQVLPRAYVVGAARAFQNNDPVETLRTIDPRSEILVERDVLPPGPRAAFAPATILEERPDCLVIAAAASGPGYLFVSDSWYPGWRAEVDGQPAPVLRANIAFRAVPLRGGEHRVVLRYEPTLLRPAAWITCFTLLTAVLLWLAPFVRARLALT